MIYFCIPSYNEAPTIGLLLWKVRQVFADFPREYQFLVADDGSTDSTGDVLQPYTRALPLTVVRHEQRRGYAASAEGLLRDAMSRTDRPKRDFAVLLHADFTHDVQTIPDLIRRLEGGADIVVAERQGGRGASRGLGLARALAPTILGRAVQVPGVRDLVSGFAAFRLFTLRNVLKDQEPPLLTAEGWAASAELIGRASRHARRIESVAYRERHDLRQRPVRVAGRQRLGELWRARRQLRLPPPAEPAARRPALAAS